MARRFRVFADMAVCRKRGALRGEHRLGMLGFAFVMAAGCGGGSGGGSPSLIGDDGAPPPVTPSPPPVDATASFVDVTAASGIGFTVGYSRSLRNPEVEYILPSGAAAGDYDNDGDIDLFIVRGDNGPNLLYRNLGNLVFEDVAAQAGVAWTRSTVENYRHGSPAFADMDGDDDLDLLLPGLDGDPTLVFANNGDGMFTDVSVGSGLDRMRSEYSMSPAFGDYDQDGDLDLMFGHWGSLRDFVNGPGDTEHLWRNDSDGTGIRFTSVSEASGIAPSVVVNTDPRVTQRTFDNTFTPTFARINDDALPDILVVADFNSTQVYINNGDGTFSNVTDYDVIIDGNGMGSALGDFDGDGDLDWFVSSIRAVGEDVPTHLSRVGNRLYRNDEGFFVDVTAEAGVTEGGWGWGSCFLDFENDGDLDIYHTNGWPEWDEYGGFSADRSRAFVSNGDGTFTERAEAIGLDDAEQGRGIVCADFDNDGDTDILQLHMSDSNAATLWMNESSNNWLSVKLRGAGPNSGAVGARVVATVAGENHLREVVLGSNFASHNPVGQLFGLGSNTQVDTLTVEWPDGEQTVLRALAANREWVIDHPER